MTRNARKARRKRQLLKQCNEGPDIVAGMHQALGEFLTEMGQVESTVLNLISVTTKGDYDKIFEEFARETFGKRVAILKREIENFDFGEHQGEIDHLLSMLDTLVDKRNNLVHGETFFIVQNRKQRAFRVGITRKNFKPFQNFTFEGNGGNIFTTEQVYDVYFDCIAIKTDMGRIAMKLGAGPNTNVLEMTS